MNELPKAGVRAGEELLSTAGKSAWTKPTVTVLEVERGTLATVGFVSDGSFGSTS